ncbi:MAG: ribonuclease HI family protein [Actinomycetota bacterium]
MDYLKIFFDGGSRGNPGPSAIGAVVYDDKGKKIEEVSECIGNQTNNVAEYRALARALEVAQKYDLESIILVTDSKLVHNQLKKTWKLKNQNLRKIYLEIISKLKQYSAVDLRLVPREENSEADALVNKALDGLCPEGEPEISFGQVKEQPP